MEKLPRGFCFYPDPPLCIKYLILKVTESPPSKDILVIIDRDPYDDRELPNIFEAAETVNGRKGLYFFTKLRKKINSSDINRNVGKGTWHSEKVKPVKYFLGEGGPTIVGKVETFTYNEMGSKQHGQWSMQEYSLLEGTKLQYSPLRNYVFCRIKKKKEPADHLSWELLSSGSSGSSVDSEDSVDQSSVELFSFTCSKYIQEPTADQSSVELLPASATLTNLLNSGDHHQHAPNLNSSGELLPASYRSAGCDEEIEASDTSNSKPDTAV